MKRARNSKSEAKIQRLTEELGPEVITAMHRAYKATAAALYRVAKKKAEERLKETEG
jgi:hypothetical protein